MNSDQKSNSQKERSSDENNLRSLRRDRQELSRKNFQIRTKIDLFQNERKKIEGRISAVKNQMESILDRRKILDRNQRVRIRRIKRQNRLLRKKRKLIRLAKIEHQAVVEKNEEAKKERKVRIQQEGLLMKKRLQFQREFLS